VNERETDLNRPFRATWPAPPACQCRIRRLKKGRHTNITSQSRVHRRALARRRHIIKVLHPIPEAAPDGLQTVAQQQQKFAQPEFADVFERFGDARIDVVALDRWRRRPAPPPFALVSPRTLQHQMHHVNSGRDGAAAYGQIQAASLRLARPVTAFDRKHPGVCLIQLRASPAGEHFAAPLSILSFRP